MDINRFTEMAQGALQSAQLLAGEYGHQQIESEHLLLALVRQQDGVAPQIMAKLNVDPVSVTNEAEHAISRIPRVTGSGASGTVYLSSRLNDLLSTAESEAKSLKDE